MAHADVLVCDGDQQQYAGPSVQNMEGSSCVDLLVMYRLIDLWSSITRDQKREMVLTGCSMLSYNK